MATVGSHRTSSRTTRKIEAPRPLKDSSSTDVNAKSSYSPLAVSSYTIDCVEKLIALMDLVVNSINQLSDVNSNLDPSLLTNNIIQLCKHLKIYGPQLENSIYQGQLDRAFLSFREGMVRGLLEYEARLHLLDIVELRVSNWISCRDLAPVNTGTISQSPSYQDFSEYSDFASYPPNDATMGFGTEDVVKRPVKLREKSSKSASKSYLRNEVIIRNSDSGKVPPTAKERVVQITGPNEENISYAARLIENTIRNNASPVKEFCESESSCSSEDSFCGTSSYSYDEFGNYSGSNQKSGQPYLYKHEVVVRNCRLTITGDDYTYVTVAKAILDDYFSKLRNSESPENVDYKDDVFLDEKLLRDENYFRKSASHNLNDVSGSGDFKSYAADFSDVSNTMSSADESYPYIDYTLLNPSCEIRTDSSLSSEVSNLSLTHNCGRSPTDSSFPSKANEIAVEPKAMRASYAKEFLLQLKDMESSQKKPKDWELITLKFPQLLKADSKKSCALKKNERRQTFCIYCETDVHNFARHLERNHAQESAVMKFIWRAKKDPERKKEIELLRKKGNFVLNSSTCIRPVRKLALPHGADDFTVCTYCMGHFSKRNFYKHAKICSFNTSGDKTKKKRFYHQIKARHFLAQHSQNDDKLEEGSSQNEIRPDFIGG